MAFGKDKSQLDQIPSFGGNFIQKAKTAARRPQRSGGGTMPHWKGNYKPSENTPDIIRLVPGDYVQQVTHDGKTIVEESFPFYMFREHASKSGRVRTTLCSGGPLWADRTKRAPCPSCEIFWEDVSERKAKKARGDNTKGPNRIGCRDQFAFTVFDYSIYYEMPDTGADGQIRMNPRTNEPYTSWVKGNPNDPKFSGRPWKQGNLMAWAMGQTYKDTLVEWAKRIGMSCSSCGTRDSIVCVMKVCPHCGTFIYDPNNTELSEEQREQIDNYPFTCSGCGKTGYVSEELECGNPGCTSPKRATLFDVDLQVQRLGTAGQQTFLQIFNYSEPRPIQVQDPAVLEKIKPLDLAKKFAPTPPETQLAIHGLQPTTPAQASPPAMGAPAMPQGVGMPPMAAPPAVNPPGTPAHVQVAPVEPQAGPAPVAMPPMSPPTQMQMPTVATGVPVAPPAMPQQPQELGKMPASPYPPMQPPVSEEPDEG